MFSVIFEVHPKPEKWDVYLENAQLLRPELVRVDGFVDNIRYRSLTREGWILSLSGWRDEKAVVRWRTAMGHHIVQEKGRTEILLDYRLRALARLRTTRASLQAIGSRSNGWTKPRSGKERRSRS